MSKHFTTLPPLQTTSTATDVAKLAFVNKPLESDSYKEIFQHYPFKENFQSAQQTIHLKMKPIQWLIKLSYSGSIFYSKNMLIIKTELFHIFQNQSKLFYNGQQT